MLDAIGEKFRHEVVYADNINVRLTVTPSRVTLKLVRGIEPSEELRYIVFAGEVAGEMLAKGVSNTWRGKVKLQGNRLTASMYRGDNRQQYWHHKETK